MGTFRQEKLYRCTSLPNCRTVDGVPNTAASSTGVTLRASVRVTPLNTGGGAGAFRTASSRR